MAANLRIGATVENFVSPGDPTMGTVTVSNVTDAYLEVQYVYGGDLVTRVYPWAKLPASFIVTSD